MLTFLIKEFLFENSKNERIGVGVEMVLQDHTILRKLIGVFRTLERFLNQFLMRENVDESKIYLVHARFEIAHSQSIVDIIQEKSQSCT